MKWAASLLLILLGLPALTPGGLLLRARSLLDEHRRECDAILALPPPGTATRPAIFEPELPGNA